MRLTTEVWWPGHGSTGSVVEDRRRQLKGRCGRERWLIRYVAQQGNCHPAAVLCDVERAALREARHQNLGIGKGTEGAAWPALELGLGH
jgi:hypothetical protein